MAVGSRIASLLLMLATQTSNVIVRSSFENAAVDAGCPKLAPGLERMAMGVDITKLDLFHDYTVDTDDGFTDKVIEYTCTEGKTWDSPYDGKTYQIPDQIDEFSALSAGMVISEANVYSQKDDLKKEMALEVGLDLSTAWASFSSSLTYKSSFQNLQALNKSAGSNKAHVTVAQATFAPAHFVGNSSLSKYFIFEIEDLPPVFNNTSEKEYFKLIRSYGTHFFHRGHFGGSLSIWFAISKSLGYVMSSSELNAQVQASFLTILKAHGAFSGDTVNVTDQFKSNSSHTERYFGGQANLFDSEGFKAWWSTIAGNPWLHSGSLVPVTDLLSDSNPKKTELVKAIECYKLKTGVNETRTLIQLYQSFHPKYAADQVLEQALHRLSYENITLETLSTIDREVQDYTITPSWFASNFKLCQTVPFQEPCCTPFGKTPDKVPSSNHMDSFSLFWDVSRALDPKLLDIVRSNATFFINETISPESEREILSSPSASNGGQSLISLQASSYTVCALEVNIISAPAWIKYMHFGVRLDIKVPPYWWLLDPYQKYGFSTRPGDTVAFFISPAPL